jgi:hypothetical protein
MRPFKPMVLVFLALACSSDPTATPASSVQARYSVANLSSESPNVYRFRDQFFTGIFDLNTDLVAFAGFPDDPKKLVDCGGIETFQVADIQFVGILQRAIKALVVNDHANLDVYRLSTFEGFCVSTPLAHGVGRVMYTDSDVFYTGGKNDTWGYRMEGPVTLAAGGTTHLLAHNRWQIQPDGTLRRIFRQVRLSGQ